MASSATPASHGQVEAPALFDSMYEYRGTLFDATVVPKDRLLAVQDYGDVRDDDVIVWTYPKAGTHWVGDIVSKILFNCNPGSAFKDCEGEAYYEIELPRHMAEQMEKMGMKEKTVAVKLEELSVLPSPRVIKTHLLYDMLPQQVQDGKGRVIYVYRDPRDMAVSRWHQMNRLRAHQGQYTCVQQPEMSFVDFLETYMKGKVAWGLWSNHFKSCQAMVGKPHILVLHYERMLEDLNGSVKKISEFLGKQLTAEVTEAISASCTFASMKRAKPNSMFLRKGVAGDWKSTFTFAQSQLFDEHIAKEVRDLNIIMPYGSNGQTDVAQ